MSSLPTPAPSQQPAERRRVRRMFRPTPALLVDRRLAAGSQTWGSVVVGAGWFESSWELIRGLQVIEIDAGDADIDRFIEPPNA